MELLDEIKISTASSLEGFVFEIIDSIEHEHGQLSESQKTTVFKTVTQMVESNISNMKLVES